MKKLKSYFIKTFGCTHNIADSQKISELFVAMNIYPVIEEVADLVIVNSCGVKTNTEQKILAYLEKIGKNDRKVIITGCLPFIDRNILQKIENLVPKFIAIIHPINISHLEDIINAFNEKSVAGIVIDRDLSPKIEKSKILIRNQDSPVGILQISEGCIGNCSFCATKNARGIYHSFSMEDLKDQLEIFFEQKKKEIWLTSQDCGINVNNSNVFFDLCDFISKRPEAVLVRIGMINPEQIMKDINKFLRIFESEKFYKFLHIPIQSANNRILQLMKRRYDNEDLAYIFSYFRETFPQFAIATDIITGYPDEKQSEFQDTLDFLQKYNPDVTNVSKFSSRPGTLARQSKPLDSKIVKERSKRAAELVSQISYERNSKWVGWEGQVLLNEIGKNNSIMGRNPYYKCIVVNEGKIGDLIYAKIVSAKKNFCLGTIIGNEKGL